MRWIVCWLALAAAAAGAEKKQLRCEGNASPSVWCTTCRFCKYCSGKDNTASCAACRDRKLAEEAKRRASAVRARQGD